MSESLRNLDHVGKVKSYLYWRKPTWNDSIKGFLLTLLRTTVFLRIVMNFLNLNFHQNLDTFMGQPMEWN